jgi:uncharacterized Zn finger protein (UPF0148 family)
MTIQKIADFCTKCSKPLFGPTYGGSGFCDKCVKRYRKEVADLIYRKRVEENFPPRKMPTETKTNNKWEKAK